MQGKRLWSSPTGREKVAMARREQQRRTAYGSKMIEKKRQRELHVQAGVWGS
jgi:hypothetical protein